MAVHIVKISGNLLVILLNFCILVAAGNQTVASVAESVEQSAHCVVRSVRHTLFDEPDCF